MRITDSNYTWSWKSAMRGEGVLAEFTNLCSLINNVRITSVPLGFRFNLNKDGIYTVNKLRSCIDSMAAPSQGVKIDWSKSVPLNVRCFVWKTLARRILVSSNLSIRGIAVESNLCTLCDAEIETEDHLLVNCKIAEEVREWILAGVVWLKKISKI
ncbi:hypothetical protein LXL04_000610 [Taraxacum kok-saghyz]